MNSMGFSVTLDKKLNKYWSAGIAGIHTSTSTR